MDGLGGKTWVNWDNKHYYGRFAKLLSQNKEKSGPRAVPKRMNTMYDSDASSDEEGEHTPLDSGFYDEEGAKEGSSTLLDGDFLEFTGGRPLPLTDRASTNFSKQLYPESLDKRPKRHPSVPILLFKPWYLIIPASWWSQGRNNVQHSEGPMQSPTFRIHSWFLDF